jgi:hypothetical protein
MPGVSSWEAALTFQVGFGCSCNGRNTSQPHFNLQPDGKQKQSSGECELPFIILALGSV